MPRPRKSELPEVVEVLAGPSDAERLDRLLRDLLTPREYRSLEERWKIVKLLSEGLTQRQVRDALNVSVTTVTRGNRQLAQGTGGLREALADVHRRSTRR